MRELKFRAWDKVSKQFLWPWPEGFDILGETTCFDLLIDQLKEMRPAVLRLDLLNDIEITQYTGLKDKNGNEIYEGDILRTRASDPAYKPEMFYRVLFLLGSFDINNPFCCKACNEGLSSNGSLDELLTVHEDTAVIGNIHDNPELLKEIK